LADTVCVACKLPNGVVLRAFTMRPIQEPMPGGGYRDTMMAEEIPGSRITVNGVATPHGVPHQWPMSSGYALTHNVPKAVWDAWLRDAADSDIVQNKLIFAYEQPADTAAAARDNEGRKSGLEPINPEAPPKEFGPRPGTPIPGGVQKAVPGMS
jgi:hypothetical protein